MEQACTTGNGRPDVTESQSLGEQEVLERAIAKLVLLGKQVGVSADQMIVLLESGLTMVELVECLAARNQKHCPSRHTEQCVSRFDSAIIYGFPPFKVILRQSICLVARHSLACSDATDPLCQLSDPETSN
jgi:hypothetical protein